MKNEERLEYIEQKFKDLQKQKKKAKQKEYEKIGRAFFKKAKVKSFSEARERIESL